MRVHVGSVLNEGLEDDAFEEAVAGTHRTDMPNSVWNHPEAGTAGGNVAAVQTEAV